MVTESAERMMEITKDVEKKWVWQTGSGRGRRQISV